MDTIGYGILAALVIGATVAGSTLISNELTTGANGAAAGVSSAVSDALLALPANP